MPWLRSIAVWILIILAESMHGTLRNLWLAPALGDFRARQVSVFTGALIIFAISWLMIGWIGARRRGELLTIGMIWILLTVGFEVLLGRWVLGFDASRILSDYDLSRGGLMGLGLLAMGVTPWLAAKLRGLVT